MCLVMQCVICAARFVSGVAGVVAILALARVTSVVVDHGGILKNFTKWMERTRELPTEISDRRRIKSNLEIWL